MTAVFVMEMWRPFAGCLIAATVAFVCGLMVGSTLERIKSCRSAGFR